MGVSMCEVDELTTLLSLAQMEACVYERLGARDTSCHMMPHVKADTYTVACV